MTEHNAVNNLRDKVAKTCALPTVSVIAQKILSLDLDSDGGELEFLKLVETDPLIAARLIGLSNSSLYSSGKKICTVREAIMRLGISRVKSIALGFALLEPLTLRSSKTFSIKKFWFHSFSMAIGMKTLSMKLPRESRGSDDLIFLSGLLHDIGYLAMAHLAPKEFDNYLGEIEAKPEVGALQLELDTLGISHAELGELLGKSWHLPEEVLAVIAGHHGTHIPEQHVSLVLLARVVEAVLENSDIQENANPSEAPSAAVMSLGLTQHDLDEVLEKLQEQQEQIEMISEMLGN